MPISDEVLLQMMFKQHEGQPIEFIMAEYGKAKRLYLEIEQGLAQEAKGPTIEVDAKPVDKELPEGKKQAEPKKRFTKRSLKCDPQTAITEEKITCCLCNEKFDVLNARHLKKHGISVDEYKNLCGYPKDQTLMSGKQAKAHTENGKKMAKANADKRAAAKAAQETAQATKEAAPADN